MATYPKTPQDEYGSYSWLKRELAGYLGMGFNTDALDNEQAAKIDSLIQSGLMQFYTPPPLPSGKDGEVIAHRWSFLSPVEDLDMAVGQSTYDLPEDFAGALEEVTVGQ